MFGISWFYGKLVYSPVDDDINIYNYSNNQMQNKNNTTVQLIEQ